MDAAAGEKGAGRDSPAQGYALPGTDAGLNTGARPASGPVGRPASGPVAILGLVAASFTSVPNASATRSQVTGDRSGVNDCISAMGSGCGAVQSLSLIHI